MSGTCSLADISGYTGFMTGVEDEHGADFSNGIPAAYSILGALLQSVIEGLAPDFELVKLEGDAVFAAAPATRLDGQGDEVLGRVATTYGSFIAARTRAIPSSDHVCNACPAVAYLDLKVVLHRRCRRAPGGRVRQRPARPRGDRRPSPAQEHDPFADRRPSVPVPDRRRGERPGLDGRGARAYGGVRRRGPASRAGSSSSMCRCRGTSRPEPGG